MRDNPIHTFLLFMTGQIPDQISAGGMRWVTVVVYWLLAIAGVGIANLAEMMVAAAISEGKLVPLLRNWERRMSGLFLYYSSRRQVPAPVQAFIAFMRRHKNAVRSGQIAQPAPAEDQWISSQPRSAPTRPDLSLV